MLFKFVIILLVTVHGLVDAKNVTPDEKHSRTSGGVPKKTLKEVTNDDDRVIENPQDCAAIYSNQKDEGFQAASGVYTISPKEGKPFKVYCDMETDGGGWTVIQRRGDYSKEETFFRGWKDYKKGFGRFQQEFWLGNDNITILTNQDVYVLRFDLEDQEGQRRFAKYSGFVVADESDNYRMKYDSFLAGDCGDSLNGHSGMQFTTKDRDHDESTRYGNCAQTFKGGWWYKDCHTVNVNGLKHSKTYGEGINWSTWHGYEYSLKKTEMKIRPLTFKSER